eukprot:5790398-Alexandrium_andersonii.AAC.1
MGLQRAIRNPPNARQGSNRPRSAIRHAGKRYIASGVRTCNCAGPGTARLARRARWDGGPSQAGFWAPELL